MAGYTFSEWISAIAVLLEYDNTITNPAAAAPSTSSAFNTIYPRAIEYAEQRIYRELDLLMTRVTDFAVAMPATRLFTLPTNTGIFVVLEQVSISVGLIKQPPLLPVSKDALDAIWPNDLNFLYLADDQGNYITTDLGQLIQLGPDPSNPVSVPALWAQVDQKTILLGPAPDQGYVVTCFGTQRPTPLSSTNPVTILTQFLPDLFLAATMIFFTGYQRDFGAQSDDPKMAQSWESQYQALMKSAAVEEARKKWQGPGWSSRLPSPIASPPQT